MRPYNSNGIDRLRFDKLTALSNVEGESLSHAITDLHSKCSNFAALRPRTLALSSSVR